MDKPDAPQAPVGKGTAAAPGPPHVTQQALAQSPQQLTTTQQSTANTTQVYIQQNQQQQEASVSLQPGTLPQQQMQPTNWPYGQAPAATAGLDPFAQQLQATAPIAIPAAASMQVQQLRAQPAGGSPSSHSSSQPSGPLVQHSSIVSTASLVSRAGSARPDALNQLQQPTDSPSRLSTSTNPQSASFRQRDPVSQLQQLRENPSRLGGSVHGSSVAGSFKQREAAMAAALANGGVDLSGSTAPLSLLGAVQNSQRFSAGGVSTKSVSPRTSHITGGSAITPQPSMQLAQLSRAASLATAAHTAVAASKLRPQGRKHTVGDSDYSSSDNDDDYEYGEAKIKRTFTRQQRKQRRQQKEEQQAQQQAQQLQQQQLQAAQLLQEQMSQAVQQSVLDQIAGTSPMSPHKLVSEDGSVYSAAAAASVAGSAPAAGIAPIAAAAVLGSSPQSSLSPQTQAELLTAAQVAVLQQQQQGLLGPGNAAARPSGAAAVQLTADGSFGVSSAAVSTQQGVLPPPVSAPSAGGLLTAAFENMQTTAANVPTSPQQQQQQQYSLLQQQVPTVQPASPGMQAQIAAAAAVAAGAAAFKGSSAGGIPAAPGSLKGAHSEHEGEASFKDRFASPTDGLTEEDKSKELQTSPSELQAEFQGLSLFDDADDDDDGNDDEKEARPWYKRPMVWLHLVAFFLSACLLFVGLGSQFIPGMDVVSKEGVELFRWMYFFALWPMLWLVVNYATNKIFAFVEWLYYLEALYALDSVRRNARTLVFMCLALPWFQVCFWVVKCDNGACNDQQSYRQASGVVWKILVCLTLFSLANFLKSLATKLLSTHFYRTAHFKKVKLAIEKEYYLLMLSQQRPAKQVEPVVPLGPLSQLVSYAGAAGGAAGTVVANGGMQVVDKLRRMTQELGDITGVSTLDASPAVDLRNKGRAMSYSGAEGSVHKLPSLASKSVTFFRSYQQTGSQSQTHEISATATTSPAPPPPTAAEQPAPTRSRLWGMRSTTPQPWLQVPANGGSAANVEYPAVNGWDQATAAEQQQQQQLGLSPVRENVLTGHVQLAEKVGRGQQGMQQGMQQGVQRSSRMGRQNAEQRSKGRRWGWWRLRTSQNESLLDSAAADSSEYAIAISASPPNNTAVSMTQQQQQTTVRAGSQLTAATVDSNASGTAVRSELGSASAFAAAAGAAGTSPRHSVDGKSPGGLPRGSAGGRVAGGVAGQQNLSKSASMALPAKDVVGDPLLQTLEKVNVLGGKGKQVDAASMKPAEWERLRTGIALKTFTALMKRYQDMSDKEEAKKLREARRFAKGLFYNIKGDAPRPYLIRDDFGVFFPNKEQADQAYTYFDKDNDAQLSMKEMKDSVTAIFKERKNMAASLKDTDSIVKTLEFGIGFVFHFIFAAVYLLVWGLDILKGFSTFSATVLALTFVFGNSVRQIYESMLFLFVEHAFDVGDLLEVEGLSYRVKKIDLMYTVLVKGTGERVYYPTTRLITLPVTNLTRSNTKSEKVVFNLDIGAASKKAREALLECVKEHYEENESDFNTCPSVNFVSLMDPFKVQLQVVWTYNFGADEHKRVSTAKTGLLTAINDCLASLDCLQYTLIRNNDSKDNTCRSGTTPDQVHSMLETGQMPMTVGGVPVVAGLGVPATAAAVMGAGGALGVLSMQ